MKTKNKSRLAATILSALAVLGIGGAAIAQSDSPTNSQPPTSTPAAPTNEPADANQLTETEDVNEADEADEANEVEDESPSYTGSITAPDDNQTDGAETADDEAAEAEALAKLATVTPDEARTAALAEVPGTVIQVELDNENGTVVYSVEIDNGNGTIDVKVDAGNAKILHQDTDNDNEADEGDEANG